MKKEMSSLDLSFMCKELHHLVGAKVDKIFQTNQELLLQLHKAGKGKLLLRILPSFFLLTAKKGEAPAKIPGFCQALRKYLGNARLISLEQQDAERIVVMHFQSRQKYFLIVELFNKGNIILTDAAYKIIALLHTRKLKARVLRGGIPYTFPETKDIFHMSVFHKAISASTENISRTLAVDLGLGGIFAQEVCLQGGIAPQTKELDKKHIDALHTTLNDLMNKKLKPQLVYDKGKLIDATPFVMKVYEGKEMKSMPTFSAALESCIPTLKKKTRHEKEMASLQNALQKQQKRIEELEALAAKSQKIGEAIYEQYKFVDDILSTLQQARKTHSWKEIKEKLKGHKQIKEVNEKTGKVILEI